MERTLEKLGEISGVATSMDYSNTVKVDFASKKTEVDHDGNSFLLRVGKKRHVLTDDGVDRLMRTMKVGRTLRKDFRTDPELVKYVINRTAERQGLFVNGLTRDRNVVSFTTPDQTIIPNEQVIEAIEKRVPEPYLDKFNMKDNGDTSFYIVSNPEGAMKLGKNDRFAGGVLIKNNPLVTTSTSIEGYLERLVCLNGMIAQRSVYEAPKEFDMSINKWFKNGINGALEATAGMMPELEKLKDHQITVELSSFLESLYSDLKVPLKARDLISRRIMSMGAETMYDIFNHITHVASNYREIRDNEGLSSALMRNANEFVLDIESLCAACNRPTFART